MLVKLATTRKTVLIPYTKFNSLHSTHIKRTWVYLIQIHSLKALNIITLLIIHEWKHNDSDLALNSALIVYPFIFTIEF